MSRDPSHRSSRRSSGDSGRDPGPVRLFLCGDVMTGRGIDQVLPHPSDPRIHEGYLQSALDYVALAEELNGPIPRPVDFPYVWGDAISELARMRPDLRIVNLETAVTRSDAWQPKGIHYRMHPRNLPCLTAAGIDCCMLANNHVLDWGRAGLVETLDVLEEAGIAVVGAGRDADAAPAVHVLSGGRRVWIVALAAESSGVPACWRATRERPGINLLDEQAVERAISDLRRCKQVGDVTVASLHWGGNWGYAIPPQHRALAHRLIDEAGVDVVHGHSSHHPMGIELHAGRPVFYGCGDFLNDYEGIEGYAQFRGELVLMYFVTVDPADAGAGNGARVELTPLRLRRFRLERASDEEARWLEALLGRECAKLGSRVVREADHRLRVEA